MRFANINFHELSKTVIFLFFVEMIKLVSLYPLCWFIIYDSCGILLIHFPSGMLGAWILLLGHL